MCIKGGNLRYYSLDSFCRGGMTGSQSTSDFSQSSATNTTSGKETYQHQAAAPAGRHVYRNAISRRPKPQRDDMCIALKIVQTLVFIT